MRRLCGVGAVLGMVCLLEACGGGGSPATCVPGDVKACPCTAGVQGIQSCTAEGTYSACECPEDPDADVSDAPDADIVDAGTVVADAAGDGSSAHDAATPDANPTTGSTVVFVINTMLLPDTSGEVAAYAFDLDEAGGTDNALGALTAVLASQGMDTQGPASEAIASGAALNLVAVRADSLLDDLSLVVATLRGKPTAAPPAFNGFDMLEVDETAGVDRRMFGKVTASSLVAGPGAAILTLSLWRSVVSLPLVGARIKATVTQNGCVNGVLGGAVKESIFVGTFLPAMAMSWNAEIKDDGPNGVLTACATANDPICTPAPNGDATSCDVERQVCVSSASKSLLNLFDLDNNAEVSVDEIKSSPVIQALLAPDLDMFNGNVFEPGVDGVKDSLSIGVGFTCVPAIVTGVPVLGTP